MISVASGSCPISSVSAREAGEGRGRSSRSCAACTPRCAELVEICLWLSRFSDAGPDSYSFPQHCVGFAGNKRKPALYDLDLTKPIGEWKSAWNVARTAAKLKYRWHDARHTFISRLAENPNVSEQTITALAGHVSKRMPERYSHIRWPAPQFPASYK